MTGTREPAEPRQPPTLRIVTGDPTPEELAAVTVVLTALAAANGSGSSRDKPVGGWADPAQSFRRPITVGPGAWRSSIWR